MDQQSIQFINALEHSNLSNIMKVPKADLHNHFVLGGNSEFIKKHTGIEISPFKGIMNSMSEMHNWYDNEMGTHFNTSEMRKVLIDATMYQAKLDGVKLLEIGEDVWSLNKYYNGKVSELVESFTKSKRVLGEGIKLKLQIGMSRHCRIKDLEEWLEPFWGEELFDSIDLSGDEFAQPIENFIPIYKKAKKHGLKLKAHIGEWGTAEDVRHAIDILELDEVQHGISAYKSKEVMSYIFENKVRLNITPTSNLVLGRVLEMKTHPIKILYGHGIDVTINSDDVLIFDSAVSKEYLRLFENKVLTAKELNEIRLSGLRDLE